MRTFTIAASNLQRLKISKNLTPLTYKKHFHFLVYSALLAYYWYVWSLLRRTFGETREDIEFSYGETAKKYAKELSDYNNVK